jgi:hypothetical protein
MTERFLLATSPEAEACVKDAAATDEDDKRGCKKNHNEFQWILHAVSGKQQGDSPEKKKRRKDADEYVSD